MKKILIIITILTLSLQSVTFAQTDTEARIAVLESEVTTLTNIVNAMIKHYGDEANTVCEGNDVRLSNARTPITHNHDVNYGSTGGTTCEGNDSRLSDARTPTIHNHNSNYEAKNTNIQNHISSSHAPSNAQKNSNITKAEIEVKLTGAITSHTHGGGSPFIGTTTANGTGNYIPALKTTYFGGDMPEGWLYSTMVKTDQIDGEGKPIYIRGYVWSGFMGIPSSDYE